LPSAKLCKTLAIRNVTRHLQIGSENAWIL
jgi:hypothetical protein